MGHCLVVFICLSGRRREGGWTLETRLVAESSLTSERRGDGQPVPTQEHEHERARAKAEERERDALRGAREERAGRRVLVRPSVVGGACVRSRQSGQPAISMFPSPISVL